MERIAAVKYCRERLDEFGLQDWSIRLNTSSSSTWFAYCSYKDKCIILNAHHVDQHPDIEIQDTINHEVAHALTPGHAHDAVWQAKAKELGCLRATACSTMDLRADIIDAIRSGATVEVDFETEIIIKPKYQVTQLRDKCPTCGKIAKLSRELNVPGEFEDKKLLFYECGHIEVKTIKKGTPYQKLISNWWKDEVKNCKHDWPTKENCPSDWPMNRCYNCNEYKLFDFQVTGAQFLETALQIQHGGAVFDEMGLGKTVQSLAHLHFADESIYPVLFVVKSGIKYQWFKEIIRWLGPLKFAQVIEKSDDWVIPNMKTYIISYDLLVPKIKKLKSGKTIEIGFDRTKLDFIKTIVADEVQQIKNPDSNRTQQFRLLCKNKKVIALSGTPWKNRGSEFFTILNILSPSKFYSHQAFLNDWVQTYYDGKYVKQGGIRNAAKFKEYIKDIAIRREVNEVGIQMPSVNRQFQFTNLDTLEQQQYDHAESDFVKWYNEHVINGTEDNAMSDANILAQMQRMRHLVGVAKIPATMEYVENFYEETDRPLTIFTHHKDVEDLIYKKLKHAFPDVPVFKLVSEMSSMEREQVGAEFNSVNRSGKRAFLVASTLAAGEGVNLQTCGDAILHERQWNPQNEDQAAPGRFRRIGATYQMTNVIFMTAADTIDEMLSEIVERKRRFFHEGMNKGEVQTMNLSVAKELAAAIIKRHHEKSRITNMARLK